MASMRGIKRRRESVQSTQQITKAMKLVSTVKLQKARARVEANEPYFELLYNTICSILSKTSSLDSKYLVKNESAGKAVLVMSSNRGLAGGYNSNIVKLVENSGFDKENTYIYALGRKGLEGLSRKGFTIHKDYSDIINDPLYDDCMSLTKELLEQFEKGEIGEIYVAYTDFKNTVVHDPVMRKLLPVDKEDFKPEESGDELSVDYVAELSEELSKKLGRKVRLVDGKRSGRIELEFYGAEDREKLIDQLRRL